MALNTPFDDAIGDAIGNSGKSGDKAKYDEYSGIAPGDSDSGGVLGKVLTSVSVPTSGGEVQNYNYGNEEI